MFSKWNRIWNRRLFYGCFSPINTNYKYSCNSKTIETYYDYNDEHSYIYICSSDLTLKIKVIVFRGAKDFSIAYSEALCSDLKKRLFDRCCNKDGCQIVPIGKAEPLYHDKSNIGKYYKHNTRIEIIIE